MKKLTNPLNSLKTRSFRVGGYSVAATVIVLVIAVLVNVIAGALPETWTRVDTTRNQLYSISQQTEEVVSAVTEQVDIYWIVQSGAEDTSVEGLLDSYTALNKNLRVKKVDPDTQPAFVQQYQISDLYNNSLIVQCGEQYRYVSYYDIYTYDYTNYYYNYTADVTFTGENALTSAIDFVVSPDLPKVYILSGHGEVTMGSTFTRGIELDNVLTETLSLASASAVPEDADAVIIAAPSRDISGEEYDILKSYLQQGGHLFLMTAPLEDGTVLTNLEALMAPYGLELTEGILVEENSSYMLRGTPVNLLPKLESHAVTDPLINGGYYVFMPVAQGITVGEAPENVTVTSLMTTSDTAFSKVAGYSMNTYTKEDGDIDGPFALAVAVTETLENGGESRVIWASTETLVNDSANENVSGGNLDFVLNAVNWLTGQQESGFTIHAKSLDTEYLTVDSGVSTTITILAVAIIPLAYLAVGIVIWVRRRRR